MFLLFLVFVFFFSPFSYSHCSSSSFSFISVFHLLFFCFFLFKLSYFLFPFSIHASSLAFLLFWLLSFQLHALQFLLDWVKGCPEIAENPYSCSFRGTLSFFSHNPPSSASFLFVCQLLLFFAFFILWSLSLSLSLVFFFFFFFFFFFSCLLIFHLVSLSSFFSSFLNLCFFFCFFLCFFLSCVLPFWVSIFPTPFLKPPLLTNPKMREEE